MKLNPSGDDTGHFQQIINEMSQLPHLTLQNDFGFPLNWVLGVLRRRICRALKIADRGLRSSWESIARNSSLRW